VAAIEVQLDKVSLVNLMMSDFYKVLHIYLRMVGKCESISRM
jgi:hypothetical protein